MTFNEKRVRFYNYVALRDMYQPGSPDWLRMQKKVYKAFLWLYNRL